MLTCNFNHRMTGQPSKALLIASIGTACCFVAPLAVAVNYVTNCADHGTGSLREAILEAPENGVVDATGLPACRITVNTGDIQVAVNDLTILGPGADTLYISARRFGIGRIYQYDSRIFNHTGTGTLTLENLTVSSGLITTTGNESLLGGCIYSKGNVSLIQSAVSGCEISSTTANTVGGGGIATHGKVYLLNSQITNNRATGGIFGSEGGGILGRDFEAHGSVVSGNILAGGSGNYNGGVEGGGLAVSGTIDIESTTISGNSASGGRPDHYGQQTAVGGGVDVYGAVTIRNSTISDNTCGGNSGGLRAGGSSLTLLNSTIAFNRSGQENAPGVSILSKSVDLESNIFANNTWGSAGAGSDLETSSFTGSHNLVFATSANVPVGTLIGKCPLLGPLRNNGGPTPTHALLSHSPAIDAGSNPAGLSFDQRGSPFARTLGSGPDIGAYEVNPADIVFNTAFEGCP